MQKDIRREGNPSGFIGKTAFIIGLPILRLLVPPMLYPAIKAVYQKFFSE